MVDISNKERKSKNTPSALWAIFGARETFIDGGLHPHLLSLGYLLLVTLISVVTGKLAGVYKTNFRIYVSKDKVKGEEVKS